MTELILAAWSLSAALLFLPLGRLSRLARQLRPAHALPSAPEPAAEDAPEGAAPAAPAPRPSAARSLGALRTPATLALYVVFAVGLVYLAPRLLERVLDTDRPLATVTSQSMYPTLKRGDLLLLAGVAEPSELKVGNIIAFEDGDGFGIHRIVRIEGGRITTKGDARLDEDNPITIDKVIGRVVRVGGRLAKIPYLGNIAIIFGSSSARDEVEQPEQPELPPAVEDVLEQEDRQPSRSPLTGGAPTDVPDAAVQEEPPQRNGGQRWP